MAIYTPAQITFRYKLRLCMKKSETEYNNLVTIRPKCSHVHRAMLSMSLIHCARHIHVRIPSTYLGNMTSEQF